MEDTTGDDSYEVGYKSPPIETQFKKGESGNPKGRPKASKNAKTLILECMNERVPIQVGGKIKTITAFEATLLRLRNKALEGDPRCIDKFIKLALEVMDDPLNEVKVDSTLSKDEKNVLVSLLSRAHGLPNNDEESRP